MSLGGACKHAPYGYNLALCGVVRASTHPTARRHRIAQRISLLL